MKAVDADAKSTSKFFVEFAAEKAKVEVKIMSTAIGDADINKRISELALKPKSILNEVEQL